MRGAGLITIAFLLASAPNGAVEPGGNVRGCRRRAFGQPHGDLIGVVALGQELGRLESTRCGEGDEEADRLGPAFAEDPVIHSAGFFVGGVGPAQPAGFAIEIGAEIDLLPGPRQNLRRRWRGPEAEHHKEDE